jgi:diaminopimelate decarboxylase
VIAPGVRASPPSYDGWRRALLSTLSASLPVALPVTPTLAAAAIRASGRWGTPLYLYDLLQLKADAERIAAAFRDPWLRLYSLKANGLPPLLSGLLALGFGANAVSSGELDLARRAGFPHQLTALEGIGKGDRELLEAATRSAEGRPLLWVSLESAEEARALASVTYRLGTTVDVLVRVNPGVRPETQHGLAARASDSKFGVLAEELPGVIEAAGGTDGPLRWRGIHLHIGSQLGAVDAWRSALRVGLRLLTLQRATLPDFDTLDVGSGFPVEHGVDGSVPGPEVFAAAAAAELEALPPDARPRRMAIEPGRAVVAASGWLIGRVLHVRDRERRLVVLDAGMTELIRPALYGAEHPMLALTSHGRAVAAGGDAFGGRAGALEPVLMRIDGPICESTDRLGEATMPPLVRDDLVAIGVVGAYGSSMASTYNGRPRPAEVAWDGHRVRSLRPRERVSSLP